MADRSSIEWTDASWNPIRARNTATGKVGWHCTHVSEGCRYCYAEGFNRRLGTGLDYKPALLTGGPNRAPEVEVFLDEAMLTQPLSWKQPRKIFGGSMTDLFADFVTDAMLDRIVVIMARTPRHTYQLVTKRPERMRDYWTRLPQRIREMQADSMLDDVTLPLPNVWLMVSAEDQATADARIPVLLDTPAAVRGVSAEPLLGGMNLHWLRHGFHLEPLSALNGWRGVFIGADGEGRAMYEDGGRGARLDLVIVGGESGPKARPMHPDWARQIRDQCEAAGVAFFFKQWGGWAPDGHVKAYGEDRTITVDDASEPCGLALFRVGKKRAGRLLDGREHNDLPGARN